MCLTFLGVGRAIRNEGFTSLKTHTYITALPEKKKEKMIFQLLILRLRFERCDAFTLFYFFFDGLYDASDALIAIFLEVRDYLKFFFFLLLMGFKDYIID